MLFRSAHPPADICQDVAGAVFTQSDDDDARLVAVLAGCDRGVDRDDDPGEVAHDRRAVMDDWRWLMDDQVAAPQGAGYILEQLAFELLAADPGALVLPQEVRKGRR